MSIEQEQKHSVRLPKDVFEQISALPCDEERGEILVDLAIKLGALFGRNGIPLEAVTMRIKSREKIQKKIERRGSSAPLRDLYGVRFVISNADRAGLAKIIQDAFPDTPEKFPDGMPSVREYADAQTRQFVKANFNPRISERHSAMHVNIVFPRDGSDLYEIAEVQILTPEEMQIFRETREEYENGKH